MTDVSTNTDVILVNTVLTFLQYGLNTATVQNVLKVASSTFSMKEVKTAVSMLWKSCDLGNVPNLRGSNNRTQCNAYLEILIKEMRILISSKKFPKVFTDALGLARIPKFNVEEITEVAMVERLMMMETKMTTMDELISTLTDNVGEINTTLSNNVRAEMAQSTSSSATREQNVNLDKKITECSHNLSSVEDVSLGTDEITCDVINTVTRTKIPTVEPNAHDLRARSNNITCDVINTETRTEISTVEPNTNDVRARSNVDEDSITVGNDSSNDTSIPVLMGKIKTYSAVTNGLKNNPEDWKKMTKKKRPKMIRGKSKNCSIKSAKEPIWEIYVRDVSKDISSEDIVAHLTNNGIKVSSLKCLSRSTDYMDRYCLSVPLSDYDKVFNDELWGDGIFVGRYFSPRAIQTEQI